MDLPQLVIIASGFLGLGAHLIKHGEPANTNYNFFYRLIGLVFYWTILYYGGFWN